MHVSCWQFVFFYKGCRNYRQGQGCCTLFQKEKTGGKAIKGITTSVFFFNNKVTVIYVLRDEEKPALSLTLSRRILSKSMPCRAITRFSSAALPECTVSLTSRSKHSILQNVPQLLLLAVSVILDDQIHQVYTSKCWTVFAFLPVVGVKSPTACSTPTISYFIFVPLLSFSGAFLLPLFCEPTRFLLVT